MPVQFTQDIIEKSTKPVIVMAFAPWCPHCTRMEPIYQELEKELEDRYTFSHFNIDKFTDLTTHFKIRSLPTFIFIDNKQEITRAMGDMSKDELKQLIQDSFSR